MNTLTDIEWEMTPSDNSHLFDEPVIASIETEGILDITCPRNKAHKYVDDGKTIPFVKAGIDVRFHYTKEGR